MIEFDDVIKPSDIKREIPDGVIKVFNRLIKKHLICGKAVIRESEVIESIKEEMDFPVSWDDEEAREHILEEGYLDVKGIYKEHWTVQYDMLHYDESIFIFYVKE